MTSPVNAKIHSRWIVLILASVMLTLSACGGGSTGSTWFNLPSVPVRVQADGSATVFGLPAAPAGALSAQLPQLQAANIQKLEVRPGYNGLHIYANGEDLPYIEWDEETMGNLGEVIAAVPAASAVPGVQIDQYLGALRKVGLGFSLNIPAGDGQETLNIPAWSGETMLAEEDPGESALGGPINIGSLAFDESGAATMEGISLESLGIAGVALPAEAMNIFKAIGADKLGVTTTPSGIDLVLGDKKLPRIAYNASALNRVLDVAKPLVPDQNLVGTLEQALPVLASADVNLDVSLTGEPLSTTTLPKVGVTVGDDGSLSAFGLPVGEFPPDLLAQLQDAGVQQLDVDISDNRILLAANKEKLPMIQMSDSFLDTFMNDMAPALGMDMGSMAGGGEILQKLMDGTPIQAEVKLPGAENVPAGDIDMSLQGPDPELLPTVIHAELIYGADGKLAGLNSVMGDAAAGLADALPEIPEPVAALLNGMSASELQLVTGENAFNINIDGEQLVALQYDVPSLMNALTLAGPFLEGTPLENPAMIAFLETAILPYAPGSDIDLKIKVQ